MTDASNGTEHWVAIFSAVVTAVGLFFFGKEGAKEGSTIASGVESEKVVHAVGAGIVGRETAKFIVDLLVSITNKLDKLIDVMEAKGETERTQHLREDLKGDLLKIMEGLKDNNDAINKR